MTDHPSKTTPPTHPPYPYYYPYPPPSVEEDEVSLLDYWKMLMKWKYLIIGIAIISTGVSVFLALKATPLYRAEVLLAPIGGDGGGTLSALASRYGGLAAIQPTS